MIKFKIKSAYDMQLNVNKLSLSNSVSIIYPEVIDWMERTLLKLCPTLQLEICYLDADGYPPVIDND